MDREERIDWLCRLRTWLNNVGMHKGWRAKFDQALADAIKESEQQPCEDAISRAEAIKALEYDLSIEADGGLDKYRTVIKDLLNAIYNTQKKAIEDLPSISTEKTGRWITTRTFMHDGEYYCDKCKCDAPNNEKWDYCPNCGARME